MSGISMVLKNGHPSLRDNVKYSGAVASTIKSFKGFLNFEMMFNAYQEDNLMGKYLSKYNYFGSTWHADSGGLQMVTQNKTINDELKDEIYKVQAEHSSYAMCFDEMPIRVTETAGLASRVDLSGRQYIVEWNVDKAKQTGLNVKRQIEIIRESNSDSKVFIICQGNETQDFVVYYNNAMAQIPEEYYTSIAGVALSAACTGLGMLESVKMAASYGYMHIPEGMGKKLHFLGFGSLNRLYPMMALEQSGYIDADITFDSSSHAMNCLLGQVDVTDSEFLEDGNYEFGNEIKRTSFTESIYKHLFTKYSSVFKKHYPNISEDIYLDIVGYDHLTSKRFRKRRMPRSLVKKSSISTKDSIGIQLYTRFLMAFESFTSFSSNMEKAFKDLNNGIFENTTNRSLIAIQSLVKVKTTEDYEEWLSHVGKYVKSNRIVRFATEFDARTLSRKALNDIGGEVVNKEELDGFLKTRKNDKKSKARLPL
jgi:hypothetical protein